MPATNPSPDVTVATFQSDLFDQLTERAGADTEAAKADLIGVDRVTIHRWRAGTHMPKLSTARQVARILDCTVEQLWPTS